MSKIEFLKEQMIEARAFVKRLMSELPEDLCDSRGYGFKFHLAGGTFIGFAEFSYYDCCDRSK